MKRILALLLSLIFVLPVVGCVSYELSIPEEKAETATETATKTAEAPVVPSAPSVTKEEEETVVEPATREQSEREKGIMKLLILGNSHSNDVFFQLARVFEAQGYEQEYMLGFVYYSGCSIKQHVQFGEQNKPVYDFYTSRYGKGSYSVVENATLKEALRAQPWDYVFFQVGTEDMLDETAHLVYRRKLESLVNRYVPTKHSFGWHLSWPAPGDREMLKTASETRMKLLESFDFDPVKQFTSYSDVTKKNILTDETYEKAFCTGSAILYATKVLGVPDKELYRDHTHMSDFGRLVVAYSFYAQLTGTPIEEVKLDKLPESARKKKGVGDLILDENMKNIIKECANYALSNPWDAPTK
ncbi:MAG: DUF4886 domain-containing protein [Clostridia bacterium]|nr:DUF4886 domain-containing protein [Clostridia bacterium]